MEKDNTGVENVIEMTILTFEVRKNCSKRDRWLIGSKRERGGPQAFISKIQNTKLRIKKTFPERTERTFKKMSVHMIRS
jgi:hypothetical protein